MADGQATRRFGCPGCGGGLFYDIESARMKCDRCGQLTDLKELPPEDEAADLEVTEFHCPQCGAEVYSTDTEVTSFCSFCGSDVVLTGKMGSARRPASIVPFSVTREQCEAAYRKHLSKYHLAPGSLKTAETLSHFRPVYIPFWSYEVEAEGPARLEGYKSYTKGSYRYDETYDLSMDAEIRQKGILYDASKAFEDETAAMLRNTAQSAVPFHSAYLSGFYAQGADVPADTYHSEAAAAAARLFMEKVREANKMDRVEMKGEIQENFGLPQARFRDQLVMMPVWLLASRQGERVIYTAVNGTDGTVVCDIPVSNGKAAAVAAGLAVGFFALLQLFLTLKPELLMALCAVFALVTLFQFSGGQKRLYNRMNRAFEPDFTGQAGQFAGPAQSRLQGKDGAISLKKEQSGSTLKKLFGPAILAIVVVIGMLSDDPAFTREVLQDFMGSDGSGLAALIVGAALIAMLVHTVRRLRNKESGRSWPRIISCAACAAGLFALATKQSEDLVYYGCALAMLAAAIIELVILNRSHNEYASRPVPFFGGEEEKT